VRAAPEVRRRDVLKLPAPQHEEGYSPLLVIQRSPADDGWLCIDYDGVVFNILDTTLHRYRVLLRRGCWNARWKLLKAAQAPTEWFACEPVTLDV
jgi:hypothetical protein